jgi:hypothetical protein
LGDIPRALALACGYANEAAVTAPDYLTRLEGGEPAGLCYAFVERFSAPARELIAMLSFMGAGPTPTTLFTNWPMQLPPDLRDAVRDELGFRDAIALLTRLALVRTGVGQIEVPRPIRRAVAEILSMAEGRLMVRQVIDLLIAARQRDQALAAHLRAATEHARTLGVEVADS